MIIGTKNKSTFKMNIALIVLLTTTLPNILAEQKFVIEPDSVSAVLGTHVTLPCRVTSKLGVLQWTKDDFGLGTHRNLSAFDRYSMIGTDDDGDYSLRIESVDLDDDGKFQCQVSPGPEGKILKSLSLVLTIRIPRSLTFNNVMSCSSNNVTLFNIR